MIFHTQPSDDSAAPGPFEGVTVLSLAEQYPGPYATLLLADLGAEVILVERPDGGDPARGYPDFFKSLARNKRSICLDLKSPAGRAELHDLAARADVFLEGYRPGVADRLGVGYRTLSTINPRLVYAAISGFGQTGPYRDRVAHDLSYQAVAGLLFSSAGRREIPPLLSLGDLAGGMFAAFGIVSALFARERTGLGTFIDVSMTDGLISWMTAFLGPAMNRGGFLPIEELPAYGCFACGDGEILTLSIVHEDHFWRALCDLLDLPEYALLDPGARQEQHRMLRDRIQGRLLSQGVAAWGAAFDRSGIPWSPLHDLAGVTTDPHFIARGMFAEIEGADGGRERHVMQPLRFSSYASTLRRAAPPLGADDSVSIRPILRR